MTTSKYCTRCFLPAIPIFGTTIATCIIALKKSKKDNATLFINASAELVRSDNKNKLSDVHQQKILNAYAKRNERSFPTYVVFIVPQRVAR